MKEEQRVYIKGSRNRSADVIKALTDLGGINSESYAGDYEKALYYINPKGKIECIYDNELSRECLLVKEFYREIQLPEIKKWKPKYKEHFYRIYWTGEVVEDICYSSRDAELCSEFGNCFRTNEEAEIARDKFKEILNTK